MIDLIDFPTTNGRIVSWTIDTYQKDKAHVRSSDLKPMMSDQGPRAYYLECVEPPPKQDDETVTDDSQPDITELVEGTLFHEYLLRGKKLWEVQPAKRGSKAWKERRAELPNDIWLVPAGKDHDWKAWRDGAMRNKEIRRLIEQGAFAEQTVTFEHEPTGLPCKVRYDWFPTDGIVYDLKTSTATNRREFSKQIANLRYDMSAAFYCSGLYSIPEFSGEMPEFKHIVVSKKWPHYSYVWPLDQHWIRVGWRDCTVALERIAECRKREKEIVDAGGDPIDAWPDLLERDQCYPEAPPEWFLSQRGFQAEAI